MPAKERTKETEMNKTSVHTMHIPFDGDGSTHFFCSFFLKIKQELNYRTDINTRKKERKKIQMKPNEMKRNSQDTIIIMMKTKK